jgi:septal ring factor EnvC (AmiA/AmiB activator)
MNLQDMLDKYINFKIQEVLDVALANKEKTVTKELESIREWFSDYENQLDEIRSLADENEYNLERQEERLNKLEDDGVMLNEGVLKACVKEMLTKVNLTVE